MLREFCLSAAGAAVLLGCAHQTPQAQLTRASTVHVCQGHLCTTQAAAHTPRAPEAAEGAHAQRLAALEALAQRQPQAAYDLGLRLLRGDGVPRDSYQGLQWLRHAGEHGLAQAQFALGQLYWVGLEEMGPDASEAHAWLHRAAAQGHRAAQALLPQAEAAKARAHRDYQVDARIRQSWGAWYTAAPYYWHWAADHWQLRD